MKIDAKYIRGVTGYKVNAVKHCGSTFDELGEYDAIIALSQKHGSGRGEHTFFSPPGGLYIVMRLTGLSIDAHTLTPSVGLAVRDTVLGVLGLDTRLKWVNDIMYGDGKAAGILCRSPRRGEYLVGIGINYATKQSVLDAAGIPGAVTLGAPENKATEFCAELIRAVHRAAIRPFDCAGYNSLCMTLGKNISFEHDGMTVRGYAERVESDGTLIVRIGKATVAVDAGEVSIIREESTAY